MQISALILCVNTVVQCFKTLSALSLGGICNRLIQYNGKYFLMQCFVPPVKKLPGVLLPGFLLRYLLLDEVKLSGNCACVCVSVYVRV